MKGLECSKENTLPMGRQIWLLVFTASRGLVGVERDLGSINRQMQGFPHTLTQSGAQIHIQLSGL